VALKLEPEFLIRHFLHTKRTEVAANTKVIQNVIDIEISIEIERCEREIVYAFLH